MIFNRTLSIAAIIGCSLALCGCGKKSSDSPAHKATPTPTVAAALTPPDISGAITAAFPAMTLPTSLMLVNCTNTDAYNNQQELFQCETNNDGTSFRRVFMFDPASIFFSTWLVGIVNEAITGPASEITLGAAANLTIPFLKADGAAQVVPVTSTFKLIGSKVFSRTEANMDQTFYVKVNSLSGGYTDKKLVAEMDLGLYMTSDTSGNPSVFFRYVLFGNVTTGVDFQGTAYSYENKSGSTGALDFTSDTAPTGCDPGQTHLHLIVDGDSNIKYQYGSDTSKGYFSFIMGGTLEKLLLRKRVFKPAGNGSGAALSEQFFAVSFDKTLGAFSDLGIADSASAFKTISPLPTSGNFDYTTTESVGMTDDLTTILGALTPALTFTSNVTTFVKGSNMFNPLNSADVPAHMSTLVNDWGL